MDAFEQANTIEAELQEINNSMFYSLHGHSDREYPSMQIIMQLRALMPRMQEWNQNNGNLLITSLLSALSLALQHHNRTTRSKPTVQKISGMLRSLREAFENQKSEMLHYRQDLRLNNPYVITRKSACPELSKN